MQHCCIASVQKLGSKWQLSGGDGSKWSNWLYSWNLEAKATAESNGAAAEAAAEGATARAISADVATVVANTDKDLAPVTSAMVTSGNASFNRHDGSDLGAVGELLVEVDGVGHLDMSFKFDTLYWREESLYKAPASSQSMQGATRNDSAQSDAAAAHMQVQLLPTDAAPLASCSANPGAALAAPRDMTHL
jgi:hypothetical protein